MASTEQIKAEVKADAAAVENFILKYWNKLGAWSAARFDTPWKKMGVILAAFFFVWMWGYSAATWAWNHVPSRTAIYGVMPATQNDVASRNTRVNVLATQINNVDEALGDVKAKLSALIENVGAVEGRVGKLESSVDKLDSNVDKLAARHRRKTARE